MIYTAEGDRDSSIKKIHPEIKLNDASVRCGVRLSVIRVDQAEA